MAYGAKVTITSQALTEALGIPGVHVAGAIWRPDIEALEMFVYAGTYKYGLPSVADGAAYPEAILVRKRIETQFVRPGDAVT
jgi:hypothetical protein